MISLFIITAACLSQSAPTTGEIVDFADASHRDAWIRHPVWGDPSFDTFERLPGNPVLRGSPPYDWPVNGFLFEDPPSGNWYLYAGNYLDGYRLDPEHPSICTVFRSTDRGAHWEALGPALAPGTHIYEGETSPISSAPDVSVVFEDGIYHMCFDWASSNTTWANAATPDAQSNSGVGYAHATRPEGPFQVSARPIATTRAQVPLLGKYRRLYASTLIRRSNDWLVLTLTDSGPFFGWALAGMTSPKPEGPYSQPILLLYPESDTYHPPLLEFFPAFVRDGFVYAPATSVAMNRNFQCIFRAPVEEAHLPGAWSLVQHGSVWHALPVENEAHGIWGQTFSGFVDDDGFFNVLFPSRDGNGKGTINLARRPWAVPYRESGFSVSGHRGPSLVKTRTGCTPTQIRLRLSRTGTVALLWDALGPLGANTPASDTSLHPLMTSACRFLELSEEAWRIAYTDDRGKETPIASGAVAEQAEKSEVELEWSDGQCSVLLDGNLLWEGPLVPGTGPLGLYLSPFSSAQVETFSVHGRFFPVSGHLLYTEALLGAAQGFVNWERVESDLYRYGEGAQSKPGAESACAKWNFEGCGFSLRAPRGPKFGRAEAFLDGTSLTTVEFNTPDEQESAPVLSRDGLQDGFHALVLRPVDGDTIPLDCLEVLPCPH